MSAIAFAAAVPIKDGKKNIGAVKVIGDSGGSRAVMGR
jgi:hypothetical protein